MDPTEQILEIALQITPKGLPRHPVDPGRSPRVQCPIGRPKAIGIDVMQQRSEPCLLVLHCPTTHAIQRTIRLGVPRAARPAINPPGDHGTSLFSRLEIPYMPFRLS
jgi:hypothetical protein